MQAVDIVLHGPCGTGIPRCTAGTRHRGCRGALSRGGSIERLRPRRCALVPLWVPTGVLEGLGPGSCGVQGPHGLVVARCDQEAGLSGTPCQCLYRQRVLLYGTHERGHRLPQVPNLLPMLPVQQHEEGGKEGSMEVGTRFLSAIFLGPAAANQSDLQIDIYQDRQKCGLGMHLC